MSKPQLPRVIPNDPFKKAVRYLLAKDTTTSGAAGPQGPQGTTGATGSTGPQGPQGSSGGGGGDILYNSFINGAFSP